MGAEARLTPRYPSWLEGSVWPQSQPGSPVTVRVVDMSLGGAAIEGLSRLADEPLCLRIHWAELVVTVTCTGIETTPVGSLWLTRLRFTHLTPRARITLAALVGVLAADFSDAQAILARRQPDARRAVEPFRPLSRRLRIVGPDDDPLTTP